MTHIFIQITYDSSDEDEAIETAAAAMAMRASVYAATVESATLEMSGSADDGATAGPSSASQDGGSPVSYPICLLAPSILA